MTLSTGPPITAFTKLLYYQCQIASISLAVREEATTLFASAVERSVRGASFEHPSPSIVAACLLVAAEKAKASKPGQARMASLCGVTRPILRDALIRVRRLARPPSFSDLALCTSTGQTREEVALSLLPPLCKNLNIGSDELNKAIELVKRVVGLGLLISTPARNLAAQCLHGVLSSQGQLDPTANDIAGELGLCGETVRRGLRVMRTSGHDLGIGSSPSRAPRVGSSFTQTPQQRRRSDSDESLPPARPLELLPVRISDIDGTADGDTVVMRLDPTPGGCLVDPQLWHPSFMSPLWAEPCSSIEVSPLVNPLEPLMGLGSNSI